MPYAPRTHKPKKTMKQHDSRPTAAERGYDHKWRKVRKIKLMSDPLCEQCLKEGRTTPALDVDHIVPLSQGGARLDLSNLQSLCRRCHNRKTHG